MTKLSAGRELLGGSPARALFIVCMLGALVATGSGELAAQTIEGVLLERGTERPIDLGLVMLLTPEGDSVSSVLTDSIGRFRVSSPVRGDFLLSATALGYRPTVASSVFTLEEGGRMQLEFRLDPRAIEIGGLTIEAQSDLIREPYLVRNGFAERAQTGFGRFITPGQIAESMTRSVVDLLSQTGRVTVRPTMGGDRILMRGSVGYCTPIVYLDGVRIDLQNSSLDAFVSVTALAGAEVYRSANEAPLQYGGGMGGCGVIVLWTRVG